jgi:hypothetical protein
MTVLRNPTYKHLEEPWRILGMSLFQFIVVAGWATGWVLIGFYASPLPAGPTFALTLAIGGSPLAVVYGMGGGDTALSVMARAFAGWIMDPKRYPPGTGEGVGYVVERPAERVMRAGPRTDVAKQTEGLWR